MWQTIDTAPVSGEHKGIGPRVLIFDPALSPGGWISVGWCIGGTWYMQEPTALNDGARPNPTHWCPLPEPPKVDWEPKEYSPDDKGGSPPDGKPAS